MRDVDNSYVRCLPLDDSSSAEATLELFTARYGIDLVVAASSETLRQRASALGCAVLSIPEPGPAEENGPFPAGSVRALRALAADPEYAGSNVLVLDRNQPPLSQETLGLAFEQIRQDRGHHLLPVYESSDSPCQFMSYFNILAVRIVHLFDNEQDESGTTMRYPCCLEVGEAGEWLFRDIATYPPAWKRENSGCPLFYFDEENGGARLKMGVCDESLNLAGAACGQNGEAVFPLVERRSGGSGVLRLNPSLKVNSQYTLWMVPFSEDQVIWNAAAEMVFSNPVAPIPLPASVFDGSHGFVVVLLEQALCGGGFDFVMGLRGGDLFDTRIIWESGIPKIRTENRVTEEMISGRQSFPEVVEPFGGFAFFCGRLLKENICAEALFPDTRSILLHMDAKMDHERLVATFSAAEKSRPAKVPWQNVNSIFNRPQECMVAATFFELAELDRLMDILSAEPAPGDDDPVFMYFFKLAVELRNREIHYQWCAPGDVGREI